MLENYRIRRLERSDLEPLKTFTDREIGDGYYSLAELEDVFVRSSKDGTMYTLVLENLDHELVGVRITYPPGQWKHGKGHGLTTESWPYDMAHTGYFQSIFLAAELHGQGWGGRLSQEALYLLKEGGAKGVVCHSWKESPNNSSTRYLQKIGFEKVAEHPLYWKDVDYNCTRCLKPPCQCTAIEMYLNLENP